MHGLTWLVQGPGPRGLPAGCMTFVRGTDERTVLAGLGVDPDDAIRPDDPEFSSTPGITIVRSGEWLVALEDAVYARAIRPDVLLRLSAGTDAQLTSVRSSTLSGASSGSMRRSTGNGITAGTPTTLLPIA